MIKGSPLQKIKPKEKRGLRGFPPHYFKTII
jgi:hypothetical protein